MLVMELIGVEPVTRELVYGEVEVIEGELVLLKRVKVDFPGMAPNEVDKLIGVSKVVLWNAVSDRVVEIIGLELAFLPKLYHRSRSW
jgi:hypothetical protein